jgi:hypothetical protein
VSDRRKLQEELNRINELYHQKDLEMSKAGASINQRQMMRDMLNKKKDQIMAEMGDDLQKLNVGGSMKIAGETSPNFPTLAKKMGKKVAGVVPLLGTAYGLMSGDPAMAAEEAAGDIPFIGQAYEAIKPSEPGNPEEERMMLAEDKARKAYKESPARMAKLQAMMKGNK